MQPQYEENNSTRDNIISAAYACFKTKDIMLYL